MALMLLLGNVATGCGSGLLERARDLEAAGDIAGAVSAYQEVLAERPEDLQALGGGATNLLLLQRYDEALPLQERITALDPDDAQTRVELGFNYLNHQDRPADAVRAFGEAVAIDPSAKHLCFLAQAESVAGADLDAENHLRRAIDAEPSYPYSYRLLYALLIEQGRVGEATAVSEQAKKLSISVQEDNP